MSAVHFNSFKPVIEQNTFNLPRAHISSPEFLNISFKMKGEAARTDFHLVDKNIWNLEEMVTALYYDKEQAASLKNTILMGLIAVAMVTSTVAIAVFCTLPGIPGFIGSMSIVTGCFIFAFYLCLNDRIILSRKIKLFDQKLAGLEVFIKKYGKMIQENIELRLSEKPAPRYRIDLENIKALRRLFKC